MIEKMLLVCVLFDLAVVSAMYTLTKYLPVCILEQEKVEILSVATWLSKLPTTVCLSLFRTDLEKPGNMLMVYVRT